MSVMLVITYLFFLHFIADFLLQPREMGKKKSENIKWLLGHLAIQFSVMYFAGSMLLPMWFMFKFALANTLVHGVIDWNIWRLYKLSAYARIKKQVALSGEREGNDSFEESLKKAGANWKYWEDHWFYATIGLDQFLHSATILLLLGILL